MCFVCFTRVFCILVTLGCVVLYWCFLLVCFSDCLLWFTLFMLVVCWDCVWLLCWVLLVNIVVTGCFVNWLVILIWMWFKFLLLLAVLAADFFSDLCFNLIMWLTLLYLFVLLLLSYLLVLFKLLIVCCFLGLLNLLFMIFNVDLRVSDLNVYY